MRATIVRVVVVAAIGTGSAFAGIFTTYAQTLPNGCTSIADVPPQFNGIQFGAAIQGLFDNFLTNGGTAGCVDCHTSPASGAAGHLDLTDGVSWAHLFGVTSYDDPSIKYVVPNHPELSLLFQKVNCDNPAVGARMPFGFPTDTLSAEQQAMIYDWIAEGAPAGTTDGVFRNGFDIRGFAQ